MEKFSYNLEFYKYNIFSLDNPKLYKRKVFEAQMIENYFTEIIPNPESIRKYILRSFKMKPRMNCKSRISYIIGLVYANDYISLEDLEEFEDYINKREFPEETEKTVWWLKGYFEFPKDVDFFGNNIIETDECVVSNKSTNVSVKDDNDYKNEEYEDDDENENEDNLEKLDPKEKIINFRKHKNEFINLILKNKKKEKDEEKIIRRAMNDWINYCLNTLEDTYNERITCVEYKMPSISKFL